MLGSVTSSDGTSSLISGYAILRECVHGDWIVSLAYPRNMRRYWPGDMPTVCLNWREKVLWSA